MSTLTETPADATATRLVTRDEAVKYLAKGRTSAVLRDLAGKTAAPPDFLLAAADAVAELEAEGLTPAACRAKAGRTRTRRRARGTNPSRPRRGFTSPDNARKIAVAFLDAGYTAAGLRADTVPGDMLLTELADAMDKVTELADAMDKVTELGARHATLVSRLPSPRTAPDGAPDAA